MIACASSIETSPHAFLGHAQQLLLFFTDLADWKGPRVIANPSVNRGARVDRKDIPIAKNRFRGRNAVDNLIIDRGANRTRESAVSLESRDTPFRADGLLRKLVKLKRRNTWLRMLAQDSKHLRRKAPRLAHRVDFGRRLQDHSISSHRYHPFRSARNSIARKYKKSAARMPRSSIDRLSSLISYSAASVYARVTEESTATPGPIVEETEMDFTYLPLAAAGFMRRTSS